MLVVLITCMRTRLFVDSNPQQFKDPRNVRGLYTVRDKTIRSATEYLTDTDSLVHAKKPSGTTGARQSGPRPATLQGAATWRI